MLLSIENHDVILMACIQLKYRKKEWWWSYPWALQPGTLDTLAQHLATLACAELAACTIPHVTMITCCTLI